MKFEFVPMTLDYAEQIKAWEYNGYVKKENKPPLFGGGLCIGGSPD